MLRMRYLLTIIALCLVSQLLAVPTQKRQIFICVSDQASASIRQAANNLLAHADEVPVLNALRTTQGVDSAALISSEALLRADYNKAAMNFLVVIGLKSQDQLLDKVWEQYATVDEQEKTIYMQGWGSLCGDIGYVESDRNPFLHSRRIRTAPFETTIFKISGTSESGVLAGMQAFQRGMLNGLVPAGVITRPKTTILDLDPVVDASPLQLPATFTVKPGEVAQLVGYTQVPGNEYRAYIDVAGCEPSRVWRYKYLLPNVLDHAAAEGCWMAGFHRMAYGNAVNIVEFASVGDAQKTVAAIAKQNGWRKTKDIAGVSAWQTDQPTDETLKTSFGTVTVLTRDRYLIMSTLTTDATTQVIQACVVPAE